MALTLCYELTRCISYLKKLLAIQGRAGGRARGKEIETERERERAGVYVKGRP